MGVMFVLVPVALVVVLAAVIAYVWAARRGQFDDLTTPAIRALHDEPGEAKIAKRARHVPAGGTPPVPSDPPTAEENHP